MAFVPDTNDPNAQNQPGQQAPMNQAPQTATSGASTSTNVPAGTSQGAAAVPGSTQAPPVQDLQAYLTANAPQAVGMGNTIAGGLNQEYQTAVGNVNSAQTAQDQAIQSGSVAPNTDLVSSAAANPTQFVQNPQNVQDFLAQENAQYTGPSADTVTAAINAVNLPTAPDVSQEAGVHELVRGMETNPTTGMENLDSLLLQENPDAMAPIQAATPQFANLPGLQTSAATTESNAIDKAISDAQAAQAGVKTAFTDPGGVVPTFQAGVNQELTSDVGQVNTYNSTIPNYISQVNGAQPTLADLESAIQAYNSDTALFNPVKYGGADSNLSLSQLPATPTALGLPTAGQVASPADYAKEQALESLLGTGYNPILDKIAPQQFVAPGESPSAKTTLSGILSQLQAQKMRDVNGMSTSLIPKLAGDEQNITAQESALQKYLASLA